MRGRKRREPSRSSRLVRCNLRRKAGRKTPRRRTGRTPLRATTTDLRQRLDRTPGANLLRVRMRVRPSHSGTKGRLNLQRRRSHLKRTREKINRRTFAKPVNRTFQASPVIGLAFFLCGLRNQFALGAVTVNY